MSEAVKPGAPAAAAPESSGDDLKNLKAEFNRKISNVETILQKSQEQLLAQMQSLVKVKEPAKAPATEDLEELYYKNPVEAMRKIKDEAKSELRSEIDSREQESLKRTQVINALYSEFPELGVPSSDLYQLAVEKYNATAKEEGHSPSAYRAAVTEAALELGMRPKSKRPASEDDFSLSGSGSGRNGGRAPKEAPWTKNHEMLAEAFGMDSKSVERAKTRMKSRKNFTKWE